MSDELVRRRDAPGRAASEWMVMSLVRYADFDGRSQRAEFLGFLVLNTLVTMTAVAALLLSLVIQGEANLFVLVPLVVYFVATAIPRVALGVRRHHDQGRSGWWFLIGALPYIGPIVDLAFMLMPGTEGPNQYGADPRALEARALEGRAPTRVGAPRGRAALPR